MARRSCHTKALEKISQNPNKFGFKNVLSSAVEVSLFDERGRKIAEPDLIFYFKNGDLMVVEYKSNGDERLIQRAKEQLYNTISWFSKYTSITPKTKIIDGSKYSELKQLR